MLKVAGTAGAQRRESSEPKREGKTDGFCLLSGDWFYEQVVEYEAWQKREESEKAARLESREERTEALERWKAQQEEKKVAIAIRRAEWEVEKQLWEEEKAAAKSAKKKFNKKKPVLGKLPAAILRPKVASIVEEDSEDGEEDNDKAGSENDL